MAAPIHILVKQKLQIASGSRLDRPQQIDRFHTAMGMGIYKILNGPPEQLIPQLSADHVINTAALLVNMAIVKLDRLPIHMSHHGPAIAPPILRQIAARLTQPVIGRILSTAGVFQPQHLAIGGHPLLHPSLGPMFYD